MVATQRLDEYPSVNRLSIADIRLAVPQVSALVYKGGKYKLFRADFKAANMHKYSSHGKSVYQTGYIPIQPRI